MTPQDSERAAESLPTHDDFNPWGPDAWDAEWAWKNFGGLTLPEAHAKFNESPDIYQEDFMFMGGKAFAFYFPVIESFLLDAPEERKLFDDRQAWILAKVIENQFASEDVQHVRHLADRAIKLSHFVRENIRRFGEDAAEQTDITTAWQEMAECVQSSQQAPSKK